MQRSLEVAGQHPPHTMLAWLLTCPYDVCRTASGSSAAAASRSSAVEAGSSTESTIAASQASVSGSRQEPSKDNTSLMDRLAGKSIPLKADNRKTS